MGTAERELLLWLSLLLSDLTALLEDLCAEEADCPLLLLEELPMAFLEVLDPELPDLTAEEVLEDELPDLTAEVDLDEELPDLTALVFFCVLVDLLLTAFEDDPLLEDERLETCDDLLLLLFASLDDLELCG